MRLTVRVQTQAARWRYIDRCHGPFIRVRGCVCGAMDPAAMDPAAAPVASPAGAVAVTAPEGPPWQQRRCAVGW